MSSIPTERRRLYHLNNKKKRNKPFIDEAREIVKLFDGNENYPGNECLSPMKLKCALYDWILESYKSLLARKR